MAGSWSKPVYSKALGMRYSVNSDGRVMTEDKLVYSKREVQLISEVGEITQQVHMVKKCFDGLVVRVIDTVP